MGWKSFKSQLEQPRLSPYQKTKKEEKPLLSLSHPFFQYFYCHVKILLKFVFSDLS